jgi:hypothetical protein
MDGGIRQLLPGDLQLCAALKDQSLAIPNLLDSILKSALRDFVSSLDAIQLGL